MIEPGEYFLWHGLGPMKQTLELMSPDSVLVEGQGIRVRDQAGRWYIDGRSSLWNASLGYSEHRVVEAITAQLETLASATAMSYNRPARVAVEYAEELAALLPGDLRRIRFGQTGSQVVDACIVLSRFHRRLLGQTDRTAVIALLGSYHGTGSGAGPVTGTLYFQDVYRSFAQDVHHVPVSPSEGLAAAVDEEVEELGPERVTAVVLEPVLGATAQVFDAEDLRRISSLCREHEIHLVFDEVSTGFGRVGALTRASQVGVVPDMLLLGKGISAGYVPLSALAVSEGIYERHFDQAAPIGSTSDAHPIAMAAAAAVLKILDEDRVFENVARAEERFARGLAELERSCPHVSEIRGTGLLWAVVMADPNGREWDASEITELRLALEENGLLVSAGIGCILIVPPLVVSDADCDEILTILGDVLAKLPVPATSRR
jgi:adenosylmethionine-8-amino-7-oxononanoate aminotransferase